MIFDLWEKIVDSLKGKPYWQKIQPLFTVISFYLITEVLVYRYIEWQYQISLSLSLYLRSYLFKQITLIFVAIGLIAFVFRLRRKQGEGAVQNKFGEFIRKYKRIILQKLLLIGLVLVIIVPAFLYFSPQRASHISVKFLQEPGSDFNKYAFVYLIYELNKMQKNWYFEVDFDIFDESELRSKDLERCAGENKSLCYAEILAKDRPFIGITTDKLGEDFFWQNRHKVSVISTFKWEQFAPPSTYEFLTYSIIIQSILIHLNTHYKGLPEGAFKESRVSYGDLFQFSPRRNAMKSMILAAHLSPKGEELLLNCFGVEYTTICSKLLTLEWLHSKRISENLEKCFGVKL